MKYSNKYHTKTLILHILIEVQIKCHGPSGRRDESSRGKQFICSVYSFICGLFNIEWQLYLVSCT